MKSFRQTMLAICVILIASAFAGCGAAEQRPALDFFYHSQVYQLIRDGVSDMHCMSDAYLAEELGQEYAERTAG